MVYQDRGQGSQGYLQGHHQGHQGQGAQAGYPNPSGIDIVIPGGSVAHSQKMNPYFNPQTGNFRKPTQQDILTEICYGYGLPVHQVKVNRLDDGPDYLRHCCTIKPYTHGLPKQYYRFGMIQYELNIEYYIHTECQTLSIVAHTLQS